MHHRKLFNVLAVVANALLLASCVDDAYDLSHIDTTTRVPVNDLTVPVNIDAITLSDIIKIDSSSQIDTVTIGGKKFYALSDSGSFASDPIMVERVIAGAPELEPTTRTLDQVVAEQVRRRAAGVTSSGAYTYEIVDMGNDFSYEARNVDPAIKRLDAITMEPLNFAIHLQALNVDEKVETMTITDLQIQMPPGMTATTDVGSYDPATGIWSIDRHGVNGNVSDACLRCTAMDLTSNDCTFADGVFTINGAYRVKSGLLTIVPRTVAGVPLPLPDRLEFRVGYSLNDLEVTAFTGMIEYLLDGMNIAPVLINDIPDFLSDAGTNLYLTNPQLYINTNNPVAEDGLRCRATLSLSTERSGQPTYPLAGNPMLSIGTNSTTGRYNTVMAPTADALTIPAGYGTPSPSFVAYPGLANLLAAPAETGITGLPERIVISLTDPCIPLQAVTDFALGRSVPGIDGRYKLMAPLSLEAGSMVIYSGSDNGWGSDDLDALTITALTVTAQAVNNSPLEAVITLTPIGRDGNAIVDSNTHRPVEINSNTLPGGTTTPVPLTFTMTEGSIKGLDGVIYKAVVRAANAEAIAPQQAITLSNIRARVSGFYEKKF